MVTENTYKNAWYSHGSGFRLAEAEKAELDEILPCLHGYHLIQLSEQGLSHYMSGSLISHRVLVHPTVTTAGQKNKVKAELDSLPFKSESVDVVVLPHTLEQVRNPHEILREVHRILIPEGYLVITGINPISCWGLWYSWKKMLGKIARAGHLLGLTRLRDWLKLLNFQVTGGRLFYYRPPILSQSMIQKTEKIEEIGRKYWPFLGGAYSIVAVKRVIPLTLMRAKWKTEKQVWLETETIAKPSANRFSTPKNCMNEQKNDK